MTSELDNQFGQLRLALQLAPVPHGREGSVGTHLQASESTVGDCCESPPKLLSLSLEVDDSSWTLLYPS